jgi:hypothetical protein
MSKSLESLADRDPSEPRSTMTGTYLRRAASLSLILTLAAPTAGLSAGDRPRGSEPAPREAPAAIDEPSFVAAAQAKMPEDAFVLAVEIEGDARAYDLNLLNRHEVVNDVVAGMPIAVVWCPLAMAAMVYDREYDEGILTFEAAGAPGDGSPVLRDRETGSMWSIMAGSAIGGAMAGAPLHETALGRKTTWGEWRMQHPDTRVLSVENRTHDPENAWAADLASDKTAGGVTTPDDRLPAKTPVFAFRWEGEPFAVTHDRLGGGILWYPEGQGDGRPTVLLHREPDSPTAASTVAAILPSEIERTDDPEGLAAKLDDRIEAGTPGVARLPGFDTYWSTWSAENPGTILID